MRCFTQVPEHDLIEMVVGGLDYSIRKKLDTQYLKDMTQLADGVWQVERLKAEKSKANKGKKERVTYVDLEDNNLASDVEYNHVKEIKVNVDELKPVPLYMFKLLMPANGKNPYELEKNDKFSKRTYTFDETKCDEIFDLLVAYGQVLVPPGAKVPPLEQRKKRGFLGIILGIKPHSVFFQGSCSERTISYRLQSSNWPYPFQMVYGKACHLLVELETKHYGHWSF